jgi:uncharacterized OB-fold protein
MSEDLVAQQAGIPLPRPTAVSRPFWEGCQRGELLFQRCQRCGTANFLPTPACRACLSADLQWVRSDGRGTVYSWTVVHRPQTPAFTVPYAVAIIDVDEGYQMMSNLIGLPPEDVRVGLPVEVDFRRLTDEITLPYFRPRSE